MKAQEALPAWPALRVEQLAGHHQTRQAFLKLGHASQVLPVDCTNQTRQTFLRLGHVSNKMNLAAALRANASVEDVDFETVWGQGHTTAERTGSSDENFIAWVGECLA